MKVKKYKLAYTKKDIEFVKELLNISYVYLNVPKGFHNKLMIPYLNNKIIPNYCLIEHSEVKYANLNKLKKMGFGKIKVKNLIN